MKTKSKTMTQGGTLVDLDFDEGDLICPITHEILEDPVIASDGQTYSRKAIQKWLDGGNAISPMTGEPITSALHPNVLVRDLVRRLRKAEVSKVDLTAASRHNENLSLKSRAAFKIQNRVRRARTRKRAATKIQSITRKHQSKREISQLNKLKQIRKKMSGRKINQAIHRFQNKSNFHIQLLNSEEFYDKKRRPTLQTLKRNFQITPGEVLTDIHGNLLTDPYLRVNLVRGQELRIQKDVRSGIGSRIVTASWDKTAKVWDLAGDPKVPIFTATHSHPVMSANFSPDGTRIATASTDWTAKVWDLDDETQPVVTVTHDGELQAVNFSPDGTKIVTAARDATAKVWDLTTESPEAPLIFTMTHNNPVFSANFSVDGTRIVTASMDGSAKVWDFGQKVLLLTVKHSNYVKWANFSPDGTQLVTASRDKSVKIWSLTREFSENPKPIFTLTYPDSVSMTNFSPDGTRIVTASNRRVYVWDLVDGFRSTRPPIFIIFHAGEVSSCHFSPDGTQIVTASWDKTAKVWDLDNETQPVFTVTHDNGRDELNSVLSAVFF